MAKAKYFLESRKLNGSGKLSPKWVEWAGEFVNKRYAAEELRELARDYPAWKHRIVKYVRAE